MADNIELNAGSGGLTLATEDEAGIHYQKIKLTASGTGITQDLTKAEDSAHTTGDHGIMALSVRADTAAATSGTTGDYQPLITDANGRLHVNVGTLAAPLNVVGGGTEAAALRVTLASDSSGVLSIDDNGASITIDGTVTANLSATDNAVLDAIAASVAGTLTVDLGANNDIRGVDAENAAVTANPVLIGGRYDSTPRTLGAGDLGALAVDVNGHLITSPHADPIALTDAVTNTVNVAVDNDNAFMVNANFGYAFNGTTWDRIRGTAADGVQVNLGTNNDVAVNAGANLIGDVGISGARTSGGTTLYKNIDVDETEDQVKATAGQLYWVSAINLGTAPRFLKIYNATAATVVVGTTVPDLTFPIPSQGDANGAGFMLSIPNGIAFSTAITIAATTGVADADAGAPGANEVIVNLGYA